MNEILVAIISGLCVAIPSIIATISTNKKNNDLVIYRIDELDKKVKEHNSLVERMFNVEKRMAVIEEKLKSSRKTTFFMV